MIRNFEEFLDNITFLDDMFGKNNIAVEEEEDREEECTGMLDFYVEREDTFDLFVEDRIYKNFRFDRDSIKQVISHFSLHVISTSSPAASGFIVLS